MLQVRPAPDAADAAAPLEHGGDLAAARTRFPDAPEPWIDLSTGINPHPWPVGALPDDCFARLPEPSALKALEATAARAYGVSDPRAVVAAPGAQALIQLLPRVLGGRSVGVLGPTYEEHAANWRRAGRDVAVCASLADLAERDVAVVVNPNNPTGRIVPRSDLLALARRTRVVIDESFADFSSESSLADRAAEMGGIVLRSFGKAYGLAGLRLGFAIAPDDVVRALRGELGPWPVSGAAIAVGARALADRAWLETSHAHLREGVARLDAALERAGFRIVGGAPLFRLAAHAQAQRVADGLGRAGLHVRRFADHPAWLRFGLPPASARDRLEAALRAWGRP